MNVAPDRTTGRQEQLNVTKNEETMFGSREGHTDAVGSAEEADRIAIVVPNQ